MNRYSDFLANSVDPDQPASSEAGWSGSTLFAMDLRCLPWIYTVCHGSTLFAMDLHCLPWIYTVCHGSTLFAMDLHCLPWIYAVCHAGWYESGWFPLAKNSKWRQFLLAFWRKLLAFSMLASAKFDPCQKNMFCVMATGSFPNRHTVKSPLPIGWRYFLIDMKYFYTFLIDIKVTHF